MPQRRVGETREKQFDRLINDIKKEAGKLGLKVYSDKEYYNKRDDYFDTVDYIWDDISEGNIYPEYINPIEYFMNRIPINEDAHITQDDLDELGVDYYLGNDEEMRFYDLPEQIQEEIRNEFFDDIFNMEGELSEKLTGHDYPAEEVNILEDLSYWTTYFKPPQYNFSSQDAIKCGLIPFEANDDKLLALGGCGMDLSPNLDCYQIMNNKSAPKDSKLFSDEKYFNYVSSIKSDEAKKRILRDKPVLKLEIM